MHFVGVAHGPAAMAATNKNIPLVFYLFNGSHSTPTAAKNILSTPLLHVDVLPFQRPSLNTNYICYKNGKNKRNLPNYC
ncbi:hypothetical protein NIASO_15445 [Niabella soli DSM 19437]|uniref:Uncharacterized protein n=1 Tax=Niabella soli DSM 19437 TaxID=929713 RepID=W0F7S0_9BACT|nr:hypothetical protein NIASO_15445 [Niabella soli DSM 19437]